MSAYTMRRALPEDLDTVMDILNERIEWLGEQGTDQWSTLAFRPRMARAISNGETWLLYDNESGFPAATLSMTTVAFAEFWSAEERKTPALYLSKIATSLQYSGRGIGGLLIDWANSYAHARGVYTLRWDVWRANRRLRSYYEELPGVRHVRTMDVPPWRTGALYEMSHCAASDIRSQIRTENIFGTLAILPSRSIDKYDNGYYDTDFYDRAANELALHSKPARKLTGLWVYLTEKQDDSITEFSVNDGDILYNSGDGWRLKSPFAQAIARWDSPPDLRPGHLYRFRVDEDHQVALMGDLDLRDLPAIDDPS